MKKFKVSINVTLPQVLTAIIAVVFAAMTVGGIINNFSSGIWAFYLIIVSMSGQSLYWYYKVQVLESLLNHLYENRNDINN
jgi:Na+-translocating ferredoxin:NAD+ oxidoreductase RnfD subunit